VSPGRGGQAGGQLGLVERVLAVLRGDEQPTADASHQLLYAGVVAGAGRPMKEAARFSAASRKGGDVTFTYTTPQLADIAAALAALLGRPHPLARPDDERGQ
jgi:hypothetical protein